MYPTCDSCSHAPAVWVATFADGAAFDVCDVCVHFVDDRVSLTRLTSMGVAR